MKFIFKEGHAPLNGSGTFVLVRLSTLAILGYPQIIHFFLRYACGQPILSFLWAFSTNVGGNTRSIVLDFPIAHEGTCF